MSDTTTIHLYRYKLSRTLWTDIHNGNTHNANWWINNIQSPLCFHPTQASALAAVERERAQGQPEGGA